MLDNRELAIDQSRHPVYSSKCFPSTCLYMDFEFVYEKTKTKISQKIISSFVSDGKVAVSDATKRIRNKQNRDAGVSYFCHVYHCLSFHWSFLMMSSHCILFFCDVNGTDSRISLTKYSSS